MKNEKNDLLSSALSATTTVNDNVLVGYWHNWDYADGYQGGIARYMDLTAVPTIYNVVNVSFYQILQDKYLILNQQCLIILNEHKTKKTKHLLVKLISYIVKIEKLFYL